MYIPRNKLFIWKILFLFTQFFGGIFKSALVVNFSERWINIQIVNVLSLLLLQRKNLISGQILFKRTSTLIFNCSQQKVPSTILHRQ